MITERAIFASKETDITQRMNTTSDEGLFMSIDEISDGKFSGFEVVGE